MVLMLSDAYRRRDRDGVVGADDVLVSIVRRVPTARELGRRLIDELNVRGSSGSPVWSPEFVAPRDDRLSFETSAVLRESAWNARRDYDTASRWGIEVWDAVFRALSDARSVGVTFAHVGHLLPALLAEKGNGAHQLLSRADIKSHSLLYAIGTSKNLRDDYDLSTRLVADLVLLGIVRTRKGSAPRALSHLLTLIRKAPDGPVLFALRREAARQAVRLGDPHVGPEHLLVAICALHELVTASRREFADDMVAETAGGSVLARWGVDYETVVAAIGAGPRERRAVAGGRRWAAERGDPPFTADISESWGRAADDARSSGCRRASVIHLARAVLSTEGPVTAALRDRGINVAGLRADLVQCRCGSWSPG